MIFGLDIIDILFAKDGFPISCPVNSSIQVYDAHKLGCVPFKVQSLYHYLLCNTLYIYKRGQVCLLIFY